MAHNLLYFLFTGANAYGYGAYGYGGAYGGAGYGYGGLFILRVPAIHDAKFHHKKSERRFFDNLSRDGINGIKVEKHILVAELKLKI